MEVACIGVVPASVSNRNILLPLRFAIISSPQLSRLHCVISNTIPDEPADAGWFHALVCEAQTPA